MMEIPKFKAEFFNDLFCPLFKSKTEPDSNIDGTKKEEIIAVTTRQLCDYYKEKKCKPISTDNLKQTYLNQLINEGIIDYTKSKINSRENIYYPIVTDSLSLLSNINSIDKISQQESQIYEKIVKKITKEYVFSRIMWLIRCRLEQQSIGLIDYINDREKFQILDNNTCILEEKHEDGQNESKKTRLSIGDFVKKYCDISSKPIDNKPSNILTDFAKRSPLLSILGKIDNKDKKEESREEKWQREQEEMKNWDSGLVVD
jgi:hypothetical protein